MGAPVSVSSLQFHRALSQQDQGSGGEQSGGGLAILARGALVQHHAGDVVGHQKVACLQDIGDGHGDPKPASKHSIVSAGCLSSFWQEGKTGLSQGATKLVEASWRFSTQVVGESGQFGPPCMEYHCLRLL